MYDVCVIGHVARDLRRPPGRKPISAPGGVVHYAGVALARLGLATAVITKAAPGDAEGLLGPLRAAGAAVVCHDSVATTVFENVYAGAALERRRQNVWSLAEPFEPDDLGGVRARIFHLGPLSPDEMPIGFLRAVAERGGRISLDLQGFARRVEGNAVRPADWPDKRAGLGLVEILKADLAEAAILTGAADAKRAARRLAELGPRDVIVTLGQAGSLVLADGRAHRIPAVAPERIVDPTGCGDSFCAGYLYRRLRSGGAAAAGRFGAALAALVLASAGPFAGGVEDVVAAMRRRARS